MKYLNVLRIFRVRIAMFPLTRPPLLNGGDGSSWRKPFKRAPLRPTHGWSAAEAKDGVRVRPCRKAKNHREPTARSPRPRRSSEAVAQSEAELRRPEAIQESPTHIQWSCTRKPLARLQKKKKKKVASPRCGPMVLPCMGPYASSRAQPQVKKAPATVAVCL